MKKITLKNVLCASMAFLMLVLPLSACGKKETTDDPNNPNGTGSDNGSAVSLDYTYKPEYIRLDSSIEYMGNVCAYGDQLYFTSQMVTGQETGTYTNEDGSLGEYTYDVYETCLFRMNFDGTEMARLEGFSLPEVPEGYEGGYNVDRMFVDKDGNIWLVESGWLSHYETPEDFDPATGNLWDYYVDDGQSSILRKLDSDGNELLSVEISNLAEAPEEEYNYFYVTGLQTDSEGHIYVAEGNQSVLYVLDGDGALQFKLESEGWIEGLYHLKDGTVVAFSYMDGYGLTPVDFAAQSWGENIKAPANTYSFYPGGGDYDLYYNTSTNFYGFDAETGESTKLLNWIDSDIDSNNLSSILTLEDGRVLTTSYSWDDTAGRNSVELAILTKVDPSEIPEKTILTMACMYLDYNLRSSIIEFNKSNDRYRITVNDYSDYNTEDDYTAGLTKLAAEIISGKVPDILSTSQLPISQYAAKGLLEDLWPFIEADTALGGRDALVTQVFDAASIDGKLYQIFSNFSVITTLGNASVVGSEPGWTVDELLAALNNLPAGADIFDQSMTKQDVLNYCCYMGMDYFVDWSRGQCNFNSQEFVKILEFANRFPAEFDWESVDWSEYEDEYTRLASGKQMLSIQYIGDYQNYQVYRALLGSNVAFKGFPTEDRNGSAFNINTGLAMSSKCADKQGAWEFMRTILTQEYQEKNMYWNFPTNQAAFDTQLANAMKVETYIDEETGEEVEISQGTWWITDEIQIEIHATTQEEADEILNLIRTTDRIYTYDEKIMDIIVEECGAFFAGQKTAQDTANIIQSRVSIYVAEQS